jgi:LDH2 family malate/lactate/ureidoglycolate dehydrogenase
MLPGEVEFRRMSERARSGIPVSRETVDQLRNLAADIGVAFTL